MKRKFMVFVLSALLCFCAFGATGCNGLFIDKGEELDITRTQLYVHNYNGDVGTDWLYAAADRFEELYAETSFEEGKKGVQILVNPDKVMRKDLENALTGASVDDVYFSEHAYYASWAEKGLLLDISDMVKEDLTEFGENESIEKKLSPEKRAMLTSTHNNDGKYYGLPHYEGFQGVNYNVKLFDKFNLYFNTEGEIVGDKGGTKSAGPDGVAGNSDDGLPASIEQFAKLCAYMSSAVNVKPFVWTGLYNEYFTILLDALTTSVLGKEATEVLYSFNENAESEGVTSRIITGFKNDGTPTVGTTVINETTGYLLWQREELYYVLNFAEQIFNNKWYANGSINGSYDHLTAQEDFVNGSYDSSNQIAMLIDGNYWEKAATDAIARSEKTYSYNYAEDSNFAWMPLPTTLTGNTGNSGMTMRDAMQCYSFIHAKIAPEKIELAKTFLKFCYTDQELINFTLSTGMTRDLDYELSTEQKSNLSKYAQSILAYRESADIVDTNSTCVTFHANEEALTNNFWRTQTDTIYDRPYQAFYNGKATGRKFFEGLATLHKRESWDSENRGNYDKFDYQTEENITIVQG